jgi:hypothetical protein
VELSQAAPVSPIEVEHEPAPGVKIKNMWNNIPYCPELRGVGDIYFINA